MDREQSRISWGLWTLTALSTLCFAPVGHFAARRVFRLLGDLYPVTGWLTKAALLLGNHAAVVALVLSAGSAVGLWRTGDRAFIFAQAITFLGVVGLVATGLLAPFDHVGQHIDP